MKITIKPEKEHKDQSIEFRNLEPGTIFEYSVGVVGLKLRGGNAVLLTHGIVGTGDCFELAVSYKEEPIKRILGKLVEIVVDQNGH